MSLKFGIREVCNCLFEKQSGIGPDKFVIDTAKMTTFEGSATTVYAQGGTGNSRLMAWEGEKTLTFTLEDALISLDAFEALTGVVNEGTGNLKKYTIKTTSFAGIYKITAKTLFRDENGVDHVATITIPRAKLQTNLNLSMAPSGDPSTFNYTFDALATSHKELFTLEIDTSNEGSTADDLEFNTPTVVMIGGEIITISETQTANSTQLTLAIAENASDDAYAINITADKDTLTLTVSTTLNAGECLTDLIGAVLKPGDSYVLSLGSNTSWFVI